jgi:uncharacterized membrane protein
MLLEKLIQSSQDPTKVSLTVRGALLGLVPMFLFVSQHFGFQGVDETLLVEVIELITNIVSAALAIISTVVMLWGLVRKVIPPAENYTNWL